MLFVQFSGDSAGRLLLILTYIVICGQFSKKKRGRWFLHFQKFLRDISKSTSPTLLHPSPFRLNEAKSNMLLGRILALQRMHIFMTSEFYGLQKGNQKLALFFLFCWLGVGNGSVIRTRACLCLNFSIINLTFQNDLGSHYSVPGIVTRSF